MPEIRRRDFLLMSAMGSLSFLAGRRWGGRAIAGEEKKAPDDRSADPWVEMNLESLTWNLDKVRKLVRVPVMAVVKANGYGHGLVEIGRHLEKAGIDFLMVGKLEEGLRLREQRVSAPVLNFGPFSLRDAEALILHGISQSVFDERVSGLSRAASRLGKKARVHIQVDTGMGRMGISYRSALPYIEKVAALKGLLIEGISTTLTEDDDFDREQLRRFLALCGEAEKKGIPLGLKHAASSDGILDLPSSHLDMVRPGILLYGYYPSEKTQKEDRLSLKPVAQLKCRVVDTKTLQRGDSVSYHRKYTAEKEEKIAVIPVGYSDGYPSNVIGQACVLIRGKRHPLIAAVTANHCTALLGSDSPVEPGDEVVLIGEQGKEKIGADELAAWAGVSAYKILISLNPLLPRQ